MGQRCRVCSTALLGNVEFHCPTALPPSPLSLCLQTDTRRAFRSSKTDKQSVYHTAFCRVCLLHRKCLPAEPRDRDFWIAFRKHLNTHLFSKKYWTTISHYPSIKKKKKKRRRRRSRRKKRRHGSFSFLISSVLSVVMFIFFQQKDCAWSKVGLHMDTKHSRSLHLPPWSLPRSSSLLNRHVLIVIVWQHCPELDSWSEGRRFDPRQHQHPPPFSVQESPQREAGDVRLPPVWNFRVVIWFHFAISSLVLLPSPITLSVLSFSACWPFLPNFFQKILQYFLLRDRLFCMAPV